MGGGIKPFGPVGRTIHDEAVFFKPLTEVRRRLGIIFDDQDSHIGLRDASQESQKAFPTTGDHSVALSTDDPGEYAWFARWVSYLPNASAPEPLSVLRLFNSTGHRRHFQASA